MPLYLVALLALQQNGPSVANAAHAADARSRVPPVANAVRATAGAPRIDGRLDDLVWSQAQPVTQFTQRAPRDGAASSERTEIRVAYDDDALYIGARMFDAEPFGIAAHLGRRDNIASSDYLQVDIDSYHDHLTSFMFAVNPVGVKSDATATNDFGWGDYGWDPVWDVATRRDSLGWTAEFRIPFSQLRFPNTPSQEWGVNFSRYIQRRGESDLWAYAPQTTAGWASIFGHLTGVEKIPQPRRLEVMPYVAGVDERLKSGSAANPFNDGSRETGRVGLDLKYGLTSNLTLNATVNPDFGQVDADPAVVNLTAYETFFEERRPFFVEGSGIFSLVSPGNIPVSGPQMLYSRRIGRAPQGSPVYRGSGSFTDLPQSTTILGATKLSGRLAGGWSLGLLEAVTDREFAAVDSTGVRFRDEVEPTTNYAVVRAMRDFGKTKAGNSNTLGFMGTAVNRSIGSARLDFLRTGAYAGGVDFSHRFAASRYIAYGALTYSRIEGDTLAIQGAQRSSARYYQRPDADYVEYDAGKTALTGWNGALGFSKEQGRTIWAAGATATSPGFEINDVGYMSRADRASVAGKATRRWTQPGRLIRSAGLSGTGAVGWNFGGDRISTNASIFANGQFVNFWSFQGGFTAAPRVLSDGLTRGGPVGMTLAQTSGNLSVSSDNRKPLRVSFGVNAGRTEMGGGSGGFSFGVIWRPSSTLHLSLSPSYYTSRGPVQYVGSRTDATAVATYGNRYLFAQIDQRTLDLTTRLNVTVTPTLSLQLYAQPFIATGDYRRFKELLAPRTVDYLTYGETPGSVQRDSSDARGQLLGHTVDPDGAGPRPSMWIANPDFSSRSLRGNGVLRWEYRPGSTLYLVWTQNCSAYGSDATFNASQDVRQLCQGRSNNVFAVKANYWFSW